jgi:hypothetical protein
MAHDHRMNEVGEPHLNKVNRMRAVNLSDIYGYEGYIRPGYPDSPNNEQSFANDSTRKPVKTVMHDDGIHGYEEYEDGSIVDLPRSMRS